MAIRREFKTITNFKQIHLSCCCLLWLCVSNMAVQLQLLANHRALRRERLFRDRTNPLDIYDDVEMYKKYRFTRFGCMHLIDLLEARLSHPETTPYQAAYKFLLPWNFMAKVQYA